MPNNIEISCIILTWNSDSYVRHCLDSVIKDLETDKLTYEIIIIDNGSEDNTLNTIRNIGNEFITLIPLSSNMGTTVSRNIGLKMATGKYIAVLDSDLEITQPHTLSRLSAYLNTHHQCGMVVPHLSYPSGKHQKSTDKFPTIMTKIKRYFGLRNIEEQEGEHLDKTTAGCTDVDYAISAFWLFRSSLLKSIGLLDENIFYAPEDVDYCLRIWLSGSRIHYKVDVSSVHHAQEISRKGFLSKSMLSHINGLLYYYRKHKHFFSADSLYQKIKQAG